MTVGKPALIWRLDEAAVYFDRIRLAGWCWAGSAKIVKIEAIFGNGSFQIALKSYGLPSPDVAKAVDSNAVSCRFEEWVDCPKDFIGRDFSVRFTFGDGNTETCDSALSHGAIGDPYFESWQRFSAELARHPGGEVLEIGSRARSAISRRDLVPPQFRYTGLDILDGPNVDVVGDAHNLSRIFDRQRFTAVISFSVFEHLAMPWKVAIELNRILKPGGLVFTQTHQTWPIHEAPWDFWRYSPYAWRTLFNQTSGFRVLHTAVGEPARIHAHRANPVTRGLSESNAVYLGSASIVQKIAETQLEWPVPTSEASAGDYPQGELASPPA